MSKAFEVASIKLSRAHRCAMEAYELVEEFKKIPVETYLKADSENDHWRPSADPPVEIAVLTGEILYQVRSSLDQLFCDLVGQARGPRSLADRWQEQCQFPIFRVVPEGYTSPVPRAAFASVAARDYLDDDAFDFVQRIQPYNRDLKSSVPLWRLAKLSNVDKHRRVATVAHKVYTRDTVTTPEGYSITTLSTMYEPHAELRPSYDPPELKTPFQQKRTLHPVLAFDEPEVDYVDNLPVADTLFEIVNVGRWVARHLNTLVERP